LAKRLPITSPGSYVAPTAIGFADHRGDLALVTSNAPLPVSLIDADRVAINPPPPLADSTSASTIAGPFEPLTNAPIHLQLSGDWQGTVTLERSTDKGQTRQGLTVGGLPWANFSSNANEPIWQESEAGTTFWLNINLTGGTLDYRLSQ
jgi:hypothetical protein